jgi:hypothetical protein
MVTLDKYFEIMLDRPKKLTEEDVGYGPAPEGSAMICASCINYYRRARDGYAVCQIFRSDKTDDEGVLPDWRCGFYTETGDSFPLLEAETEQEPLPADEEED